MSMIDDGKDNRLIAIMLLARWDAYLDQLTYLMKEMNKINNEYAKCSDKRLPFINLDLRTIDDEKND